MSKPIFHARSSAKKFGGKPEDYQDLHQWMDSTKSAHATVKHRAILHSAFGIFLAEQVFGLMLTNSDGKEVCVRDIAEQHVIEDLGFIPSLDDWLNSMAVEPWMAGALKGKAPPMRNRELAARRALRIASEGQAPDLKIVDDLAD